MIKKMKITFKEKINKPLLIMSFLCYLVILIWIILFKANIKGAIYSGPGDLLYDNIIVRYEAQFNGLTLTDPSIIEDIILNMIIFIPLPIYVIILNNKAQFWLNLLIVTMLTFCFETFQLFFGIGNFQYLDIFSNIMGGIIGFFLFKNLKKHISVNVINYINLFVVLISLPIAIFAVINTIIHYEYYIPFFDGTSFKNLFNFKDK